MTSFTRRDVVGASLAAMAIAPPLAGRVPGDSLPTLAEIDDRVRTCIRLLGSEARTERLGASGEGRAIDLVSVGRGSRSVLIVGAPHANEPIGCLTILTLLERLAHDRALRQAGDISWHFIPVIDPDGVALNEGWFKGPRTLERYFRSFFRPAFALQPEYAFPLAVEGYRFDASTPENRCWQRALDLTRPIFQSSLHGNETTGIFYLLTRNLRQLADALSTQPWRAGMGVDRLGEVDAGMVPYAPGVLSFFEVKPMIAKALAGRRDPSAVWSAGQSSAEYARDRYGTFSMICEISQWDDLRLHSDRPSGSTIADVLGEQLDQAREDEVLMDAAATLLGGRFETVKERMLADALREARAQTVEQLSSLPAAVQSADRRRPLALRDLVQWEPGTAGMRMPAMLARLARSAGRLQIAASADQVLQRRILSHRRKAVLRTIPYQRSADLQMEAITTTARILAG